MKKIFMAMLLLATTACTEQRSGIELLDPADFTTTVNNSPVTLYTLKAGDITMQVTNYGGRVVSLWVPDRDGNFADIEIGYQNISRYIDNKGERYLGAVVGPYANRIADGRFTLDGKEYTLPQNDNDTRSRPHCLECRRSDRKLAAHELYAS